MILINKQNNLKITIENSLIKKLGEIALKHYPNEFGGFLIGSYSLDFKTVKVEDFILPIKYKNSPTFFERYTEGIETLFIDEFKINNNRYYIGEWHSHPNGSALYSLTDLNAMINTVSCSTVTIENPILLILSIDNKKVKDFRFYCYCDKKLLSYE